MIKQMVESRWFHNFVIGVILVNGVVLGIETVKGLNANLVSVLESIDRLCLFMFVVELVLNPDGQYRARLEIVKPEESNALTFRDSGSTADRLPNPADLGFSTIYWPRTARGTLIPPAIVDRIRATGARVRTHRLNRAGNIIGDTDGGRHFGEIQKRMIRLRDNRCRHAGCRRTARTCQYDHVEPYERGGPTLIANGQLLCRFHHRWKHRHDSMGSRIFDDSPVQLE